MKKDNYEYIKEKFDADGITAPESLHEDTIAQKLAAQDTPAVPIDAVSDKPKIRFLKPALSLAACLVVVVAAVFVFGKSGLHSNPPVTTGDEPKLAGIEYYESREALTKKLEGRKTYLVYEKNGYDTASGAKSVAIADGATAMNSEGSGGSTSESFASTNRQAEAVDEADIIKTDGKYIYYVCSDANSTINIFPADKDKADRIAVIETEGENCYVAEIFLYEQKLIAIGTRYETVRIPITDGNDTQTDDYESGNYTFVKTYDISDPAHPELIDTYEQSGYYNTSRMIGSNVYVISYYGGYYFYTKDDKPFIPCATCSDGQLKELNIKDICGIKDAQSDCYSVIGAVDVANGTQADTAKAILGVNDKVYCNVNHLYLTGSLYDAEKDTDTTRIVKYTLSGTAIRLAASGEVKGDVNDQFSMDEKDGKLRIALTQFGYNEAGDKNCLYVLDSALSIIGKTEDFANNEHIEAVRYIGDIAYVITYERTDPLFIIDLSDPTAPHITGEVKIDGFSAFLTPVDENTLLGIGYCTAQEDDIVYNDGLKLTLFDVSDKKTPKVLDAYELRGAESAAQFEHKALVINSEKGYYAIPYAHYEYTDEGDIQDEAFGALVIRTDGGKLGVQPLNTRSYTQRCTYIGDYLYIPDAEGFRLEAFKVK